MTMRRGTTGRGTPWPQWINLALGVWLFISAFLWFHTVAAGANSWIVGLVIAGAAAAAFWAPPVQWIDTAAGIYLFLSTNAFRHANGWTVWNNVIVAVLVVGFSLFRTDRDPMLPHAPA
ncbi:MAG TPA: hypothetical protein VHE35_13490 [Kofleriaceae bacterium]|nr:hypothetical protein [Kofleriaceae bacterium]